MNAIIGRATWAVPGTLPSTSSPGTVAAVPLVTTEAWGPVSYADTDLGLGIDEWAGCATSPSTPSPVPSNSAGKESAPATSANHTTAACGSTPAGTANSPTRSAEHTSRPDTTHNSLGTAPLIELDRHGDARKSHTGTTLGNRRSRPGCLLVIGGRYRGHSSWASSRALESDRSRVVSVAVAWSEPTEHHLRQVDQHVPRLCQRGEAAVDPDPDEATLTYVHRQPSEVL